MSSCNDVVLRCKGVSHWFGSKNVLHEVNFDVLWGQVVAVVGPSGCGKSTLLKAILGTHPPKKGTVVSFRDGSSHGKVVTNPDRNRGIVYQRYSLFPNMTAVENVAFGLMLDQSTMPQRIFRRGWWKELRKKHIQQSAEMLDRFGLGKALNLYPNEMSGGMCQRVAIAQALIMEPRILLLDEPFGALDEATREELQHMLLKLYAENQAAVKRGEKPPYTIFLVTHEINEAIYVGDRVIGLSQYWNWSKDYSDFPGATIVYDKSAPVFLSNDVRDFESFRQQKEEILNTVFDPDRAEDYGQYVKKAAERQKGDGDERSQL